MGRVTPSTVSAMWRGGWPVTGTKWSSMKNLPVWRFTHGYVENVAAAIALAATSLGPGGVFNAGEEETPTREDWLRRIFDAAGWDADVVVVPGSILPAELKVTGLNLRQDMLGDGTKIRLELGFTEPVEWAEGVERTIAWEIESLRQDGVSSDTDYAAEDAVLAALPVSC